MTVEEIKIRQLTNQYLIAPSNKETVVHDLCGIQAQFLSYAMHALKIRCRDYNEANLQTGLVKNWTIRGTVHIFAEDDLPVFLSCNNGRDYRRNDWHEESFWNQRADWALTPERQAYFSRIVISALQVGDRSREELKQICRAEGITEPEEASMFYPWGGGIRQLCERGFMNYVVQEEKAFRLSPEFTPIPEAQAQLEQARRYFTSMGPATIHDAMYFFHTSATQIKTWLSQLPVVETVCDRRTYYYIGSGLSYTQSLPKCIFLAGSDPLLLAYEKKESLYLPPEHMRQVFNLGGIVMPTVLMDGQIIGTWKKKGNKLSITLFQSIAQAGIDILEAEARTLWNSLKSIELATKMA